MTKLIFTWGKFQPPHRGHKKIVDLVHQMAKENDCDGYVFSSQSKDFPISSHEKELVLREAFGEMTFVFHRFCDVISYIVDSEYDSAVLVIGEDRLADFQRMLPVYEKESPFPIKLNVVSGGKRVHNGDFIEGLSSTLMRQWVKEDNRELFRAGLPETISDWTFEFLYNSMRFAK